MTEKNKNLSRSNVIPFNSENKAQARERLRRKEMINTLTKGQEYSINKRVECLFTERENITENIFYGLKNKLFSTGKFKGWITLPGNDEKKLVFLGKAGDKEGYFFIDPDNLLNRTFVLKK